MKTRITQTLIKTLEARPKPFEIIDTDIKGFLLRVQPTGGMCYYFSYRTKDGTRKRFRIGTTGNVTPAQARDRAEDISAEVIKGTDVAVQKKELKKSAKIKKLRTLKVFIESSYEPWVISHRKTGQRTIKSLKSAFPMFMSLSLEDISLMKVEQWRNEKLKSGVVSSTVNRLVVMIRALLSKALEWEVIDVHPLAKLKPLKVDTSPIVRYLKPDEEFQLLKTLNERDTELKQARKSGNEWRKERGYQLLPDLQLLDYADRMYPMILVSLKTGLRRGELFSLCWVDVQLEGDAPTITVRAEESKSSKVRYIPLSPMALEILQNWYKQRNHESILVFPSNKGTQINNVTKSWVSILDSAGIVGFRWHDMRHDFASKLVMKGVPLNTVRELCGHSSLNTTLRYAHLAPDHKADAVALLG